MNVPGADNCFGRAEQIGHVVRKHSTDRDNPRRIPSGSDHETRNHRTSPDPRAPFVGRVHESASVKTVRFFRIKNPSVLFVYLTGIRFIFLRIKIRPAYTTPAVRVHHPVTMHV